MGTSKKVSEIEGTTLMIKMKHVLFIVENNTVPQDPRVWRQALAVKKWGHEVSIICRKEVPANASYENIDGIDIYRHYMPPDWPNKISFLLEYIYAVLVEFILALRLYMKKPFHIIHAANPPDIIFIIGVFFKLFKVRYIFDVHDLSPELYSALYGEKNSIYRKALILAEKLSCSVADVIITTNQSYRNIIRDRHCIDYNRLFVVRNDFQADDFITSNSSIFKNVKGGKIILFIGSINYQDGVIDLIKSLYFLKNFLNEKNFKGIIIGSGRAVPEVEKAIIELGLVDEIELKGRINDRNIIRYYLNIADVCVEPAPYNKINNVSTFIKILEYMASGKPIVAFDLMESRYSANGSAIFVKPGDTKGFAKEIKRILNDIELGNRMGTVGKERVRNELNWENSVNNLKAAYRTVFI
jgi:glycosyltransferase involved in cell wall biosynthesis